MELKEVKESEVNEDNMNASKNSTKSGNAVSCESNICLKLSKNYKSTYLHTYSITARTHCSHNWKRIHKAHDYWCHHWRHCSTRYYNLHLLLFQEALGMCQLCVWMLWRLQWNCRRNWWGIWPFVISTFKNVNAR